MPLTSCDAPPRKIAFSRTKTHGRPGSRGRLGGNSLRVPADADKPARSRVTADSKNGSEQDDRASGFAWYAREPQLMCGAKGRASSQRFTEYHVPAAGGNALTG